MNVLNGILDEVEKMIKDGEKEVDMKKVKNVDKRLRQCSNPARVPGTALSVSSTVTYSFSFGGRRIAHPRIAGC